MAEVAVTMSSSNSPPHSCRVVEVAPGRRMIRVENGHGPVFFELAVLPTRSGDTLSVERTAIEWLVGYLPLDPPR